MRRIAIVIAMLLAMVSLVFVSYGEETIITTGGSVLTGVIESGLPATVSVTSNTGDVFTVQRSNMKHVRFGDRGEVTVETFDGNIIVGMLGGISDVFGLRTLGGDVQSLSVDSIVEIRFEPPALEESESAQAVEPVPPSDADALVQAVVDVYEGRSGSFTLGIDSGLQLGFSVSTGSCAGRCGGSTSRLPWRVSNGPQSGSSTTESSTSTSSSRRHVWRRLRSCYRTSSWGPTLSPSHTSVEVCCSDWVG